MTERVRPVTPAEIEGRLRELTFLERVVRLASSTLDHGQMLKTIIDETTTATGTQVCSLYLWEDSEKVFVLTATNGLSPTGIGRVKLGLGEGVTGWVAAQRQPLAVRDVRYESRFTWVPNLDQDRFISMLSVPIVTGDKIVGVMNLQTVQSHIFTQPEIDFASAIAAQIGGIIQLSSLNQKVAKQLEMEREVVASLRALNASRSDFMSMLSHDFRGPLSIAKSYLHGLISRLGGEEKAACEEIDSELEALRRMVDNLLLSLQLEAQNQLVLDLEKFDLVKLIRDQTRRVANTAPGHSIDVTAPPKCTVTGDPFQLQAVMVNLLGNAIKYSPEGGSIDVRVQVTAPAVEVSVTDSGIGIDERNSEALFEPYGRGGNAQERGIAGHGLGLFICKRIVEAHGGRIYARPVEGGLRFAFTLPLP